MCPKKFKNRQNRFFNLPTPLSGTPRSGSGFPFLRPVRRRLPRRTEAEKCRHGTDGVRKGRICAGKCGRGRKKERKSCIGPNFRASEIVFLQKYFLNLHVLVESGAVFGSDETARCGEICRNHAFDAYDTERIRLMFSSLPAGSVLGRRSSDIGYPFRTCVFIHIPIII